MSWRRATPTGPKAAALLDWIDEDRARRDREALRDQGRNEVLRALLLGTLKIRNQLTGEWIGIPSPWTDAEAERWQVTREQFADLCVSPSGLPPESDSGAAALARIQALRTVR
jgi:hypothetical protein